MSIQQPLTTFFLLFFLLQLFLAAPLIVNGDFSSPNVTVQQGHILTQDSILGWTGKLIDIGLGTLYNSNWWPGLPILNLDTGTNQIISQSIHLPTTTLYLLSFSYATRQQYSSSSSATVTFNSITKTLDCNDDQIHYTSMIVQGQAGLNTLTFTGTGAGDSYGMGIAQVSLQPYNLLVNSNFDFPRQKQLSSKMYQGGVLGWSTNGNLEIAYGPKVNANWEGQVLDTVSDSPQTYTQSVSNMVMGAIYTLKFSYAAKSGLSLASQAAQVLWNGQSVKILIPTDYGLHTDKVDVQSAGDNNEVGLRATPFTNITDGISFGKVQLYLKL